MGKNARASRRRVPSVASEFMKADLGDVRLERRLAHVAEICSQAPDHSFPDMAGTRSELESLYRFTGNSRVEPQDILRAHAQETAGRCRELGKVVVPHDTTECAFSSEVEREGLGPLSEKRRGFLFHASIAVAADGVPRALGVLHGITWVREKRRRRSKARRTDEVKESARWDVAVRGTRELLGPGVVAIHVMDREGDAYPLLAAMCERGDRFVVRAAQDRVVLADGDRLLLHEAVARAEEQFEVEVALSKRGEGRTPYQRETFPTRDRRNAVLSFSARTLALKRPKNIPAPDLPPEITVNVIHVWEPNPPEGAEPVEWFLVTSEPIDSNAAIKAAVDYYRARWVVEEFFKALKTGCAYETRQLTNYHSLLVALMVFLPIACRLLFLRSLARSDPGASAKIALTQTEIDVLRVFSKRVRVPAAPTIKDVILAIAGLGGHLKNNGNPGWLTLARGMEKLLSLCAGWEAALASVAP
jgi:hypothetical protein